MRPTLMYVPMFILHCQSSRFLFYCITHVYTLSELRTHTHERCYHRAQRECLLNICSPRIRSSVVYVVLCEFGWVMPCHCTAPPSQRSGFLKIVLSRASSYGERTTRWCAPRVVASDAALPACKRGPSSLTVCVCAQVFFASIHHRHHSTKKKSQHSRIIAEKIIFTFTLNGK